MPKQAPPPSSFTDPATFKRRLSVDSVLAPSISDQGHPMPEELPPPNAPFMAPPLRQSPSSNSLYRQSAAAAVSLPRNSSTNSFRAAPFLSPAARFADASPRTRPSSWAPPVPYSAPDGPPTPNGLGQTPSSTALALAYAHGPKGRRGLGRSTRLVEPLTKEDKPWVGTREPKALTSYILTLATIFLGLLGAAALCWDGWRHVALLENYKGGRMCLVMSDEFQGSSLDSQIWNTEVQAGGFGNNEFQLTSDAPANLHVVSRGGKGELYLTPTLTADQLGVDIFDGGSVEVEGCTAGEPWASWVGDGASPSSPNGGNGVNGGGATGANNVTGGLMVDNGRDPCRAVGNVLNGAVVPPVISARINTKLKKAIRFGKVEVSAKLPRGDWLWPAIWMLPDAQDGIEHGLGRYGPWPLSGEIDLVEGRGNDALYGAQGRNFVHSSLNYGPMKALYTRLYGWQSRKRAGFDEDFHTYTLEWTPDFMRMYVDSRLISMLEVKDLQKEKKSFWARGAYPQVAANWTADGTGDGDAIVVKNIWEEAGGSGAAPFDQPFYLIISLSVGGTSGWFPDSVGGKPWYDKSATAMRDFARAQKQWYKTWGTVDQRSLRIRSVKMWEFCGARSRQ